MSRTRFKNAERKQRKALEGWDPESNRWMWHKYARCGLCNKKFVVNNYPDKKVRVNQHKVGGVILCAWCNTRHGKFVVQLLKITQKVAEGHCPRMMQNIPYGKAAQESFFQDFEDNCKCDVHVARRILIKAGKLETGRAK